jgi:DNA helicase-4
MTTLYSIEDLVENLEEIRKLKEFERFRKFLKFFLIGFFTGRNNEKRIKELTSKTYDILSHLLDRELLEKNQTTIPEKSNIWESLNRIEEIIKSHKNDFSEFEYYSNLNKIYEFRNRLTDQTRKIIEQGIEDVESQLKEIYDSGTYLISTKKKECEASTEILRNEIEQCTKTPILDADYIHEVKKKLDIAGNSISSYNTAFVKQRKKDYSYLWNNRLFTLDDEQQTAVVTDDKHNLVVAAAGSGKTEVLITRIAYIIKRQPDSTPPERILAIAYQRKAREEIEKRLRDRYNIKNTNVSTFHKLGKDILEQVGNKYFHTDIVDENKKNEIIEKIFNQKIDNDPDFYNLFLSFVKNLDDKEEKEDEKTKDEALSYAKERTYYALDKTRVKSRAEKEIMDFFLTHKLNGKNIAVKYEPDVNGFRPDFYLPEYDLYIEHWAITKDGTVPEWFNQTTEEYMKSIEMKNNWFFDNDKQLVETNSHEYNRNDPNKFIELLKERLIIKLQNIKNEIFDFTLKNYKEIVEIVWKSDRTPIEDIANFITIAKTYGLSPEKIKERLKEKNWSSKQKAFANLALPVYINYEEILNSFDKIDFEDMINKAIDELDKNPNLRADVYDHILIDEYQDISAQRNKLIEKLMERNPKCKLFCVGDDWQSIMGFSGSNVNFFVNFGEYFEDPATTIISTNYRSYKTIVDAGASLIRNNTCCQIQKPTKARKNDIKLIRVLTSPHKKDYEYEYIHQIAEDCTSRINKYLQKGYSPRDILVLSRYMRTRIKSRYKFLSNIKTFIKTAKQNNLDLACGHANATNRVRLLTAHKSKGLEAKVVFLLNVTKGTYGFPCELQDSNIFEIARMEYPPQDNLEEERRLFYVAMTRAKEDLYIYTWEPAISDFLSEIEEHTMEIRLSY